VIPGRGATHAIVAAIANGFVEILGVTECSDREPVVHEMHRHDGVDRSELHVAHFDRDAE
jgi:hypothetical protein